MAIKAIVFDAYGTLYDVQSIEGAIDAAFPGFGPFIAQVWRLKQLEYTWLRSMMGRYEDFWRVTRDALAYTLQTLGLHADSELFDRMVERYNRLDLYPDVRPALEALSGYQLAILSNGSPDMLQALVSNSGMQYLIPTVVSVDSNRAFKPDPRAYELVEERLGLPPDDILFVSSNGFDVSGAKSFGFTVVQIERVSSCALQAELTNVASIGPSTVFKTLRAQAEHIGFPPDFVIDAISSLTSLMAELGRPTNVHRAPSVPHPAVSRSSK
jgi:2-haloacid dehalogenase